MTGMAMPLSESAQVTTTSSDGWHATLRMSGEFDVATAALIRDAIGAHLDAGRRVLHIDTSGVTFVDSTAIGALVSMHARCQQAQGSLILTGVAGAVARLLDVTGLDQVFLVDGSAPTRKT